MMNDIEMHGNIACPGVVSGYAYVIDKNPPETEMRQGQILVIKHSSPEYFNYFLKASAILTEIGGISCHAASIARDLNIPCIVAVDNLISNVQTESFLNVDANEGSICVKM